MPLELAGPLTPRDARLACEQHMAELGYTEAADDLGLVVSELVTNAEQYGNGLTSLRLEVMADVARLEISDRSPKLPRHIRDAGLSPKGRGMQIITCLSQSWGVQPQAEGKTIWVEIGATSSTDRHPRSALPAHS